MSNKLSLALTFTYLLSACTENDAAHYVSVPEVCYIAKAEYRDCITDILNSGCPDDMGVQLKAKYVPDMGSFGESLERALFDSGVESEQDAEVQPPSLCRLSEAVDFCEHLRSSLNDCLDYCDSQSEIQSATELEAGSSDADSDYDGQCTN